MKKKFFNLAVILATLMSSSVFSSCGDDDDDDENNDSKKEQKDDDQKQEQTTDKDDDQKQEQTTEGSESVKVAENEVYNIQNDIIGSTSITIKSVGNGTVTVEIFGDEVTIGTGSNPSYALYITEEMEVVPATQAEAQKNPGNVLFICNGEATLSSGTKAKDTTINSKAKKTTFSKAK